MYRVKNWPEDWRAEFEERAAIMEFDGGLSREDAEIQAYEDVLSQRLKVRDER